MPYGVLLPEDMLLNNVAHFLAQVIQPETQDRYEILLGYTTSSEEGVRATRKLAQICRISTSELIDRAIRFDHGIISVSCVNETPIPYIKGIRCR